MNNAFWLGGLKMTSHMRVVFACHSSGPKGVTHGDKALWYGSLGQIQFWSMKQRTPPFHCCWDGPLKIGYACDFALSFALQFCFCHLAFSWRFEHNCGTASNRSELWCGGHRCRNTDKVHSGAVRPSLLFYRHNLSTWRIKCNKSNGLHHKTEVYLYLV